MKATLYKTLSNEKTPIEVKARQTVREALPDFDLENAIILINGKIKNPDYRLKENDTATIRLTPQRNDCVNCNAGGCCSSSR